MMLAALCVVLISQSAWGPTLPPGVGPETQRAFYTVEQSLSQGNFSNAAAKLALLPNTSVVYNWDDSKVPESQRKLFAQERDRAFDLWKQKIPNLTFKIGPKPQIKFNFEPTLATDPTSGLPRGIALFFSENPEETRMEAVIGLKRGNPLEPTSEISVHNEVLFAVGSYLGLGAGPLPNTSMFRSDLQWQSRSLVEISEAGVVIAVREAVKTLTKAVNTKQKLRPARPKVALSPTTVEQGPVLQGTPVDFSIQLNNVGEGPLAYRVIPDCGCISVSGGGIVDPDSSGLVRVRVNTQDIAGPFSKHLIVITNDAEKPLQYLPIKVTAQPRYRFLSKEGPVLIVDEGGLDADVFLVTPAGHPLDLKSVELVGNPGTATFEKWTGSLPDPDLNEPAKPREGHRIKLHFETPLTSGRSGATVIVKTGDPIYPELRYTVLTQKGIAILPASVFLGEVGKVEKRSSVILTRPSRPFKVTKIESDSSFVTATATMTRGDWEYKLNVVYDGKAPLGDLRATLTVYTDDAKQSKIRVAVTGLVR